MVSKYSTFGWRRGEKSSSCCYRIKILWRKLCPCWPFQKGEDMAPLTENDGSNTPVRYRRSNRRTSSQPYLQSINNYNPVPNITLDRWDTIVSDQEDSENGLNHQRPLSRICSPRPSIDLGSYRLEAERRKSLSPEPPKRRRSLAPSYFFRRRSKDDADISSKSGTPSPMVSRGGGSSACDLTDLRDFPRSVREGSAPRSVREGSAPRSVREGSVPRSVREGSTGSNDTVDGEDEKFKSSTLGNRSESLASIYSQGEGRYGTVSVHGDIEFGFMYNLSSGSLDISIKQCRDLAAVDTKRNRSDPYVKVYLLPDKSKPGKRKTKVKKHTLNPVFEEILKFMMPLVEVERRTMWISVWHSDMFGRNDFLGEVSCYLLPDRVGKNKQKTSICRRTTSPRWDTTMTWDDLSISEVEDRSLEIILYDHDRMGHHEMMGGIRLNLGTGKHGGKAASWMDGAGRELTLWQQMLDRQNFWVEGSVPVRTFLEPVNTRSEKQ
ncbi:synaptotagmin-like protein 2 [Eurytemora carolleeae]|uniref:synaptotagmin-like protein 2 n=1 Tax=Eurytemora carolleeae TaxID=1294199 RepID=UPI000C79338F|nr:synaptotagmin-like protein 2 [Eurytemora carolleeae]|eukprot:XP_023347926.1 synaptotagmin-like protein 2 [Eurytemora affinis]